MGRVHNFVGLDGEVLVALEERGAKKVAFVGHGSLFGRKIQISAPSKTIRGVARVAAGAKIGICSTDAGILITRRCLISMHNRGLANVHVMHGYLVTTIVL